MHSSEYAWRLLETAARSTDVEPDSSWALRVVTAPPNGDQPAWQELGVETRRHPSDRSFDDFVLAVIDIVANDAQVATDFVAELGQYERQLAARLTDRLYADIATRALNHLSFDPGARRTIASWALDRVTDPSRRLNAVMYALNPQQGTQFTDLLSLVRELRLADAGLIATVNADRRVTEKVEAIGNATTAAEEATKERLRRAAREKLIRDNPAEAFDQFAAEVGLNHGTVATFNMAGHPDMWAAALRLVRAVTDGEFPALPPLVTAALDRALEQRASGTSFRGAGGFSDARSVLDRYQELPVLAAESLGEFQRRLDALAQMRNGITDATTITLYNAWRRSLIGRRRNQRSAQVLADAGDWAGLQFPHEFSLISVEVSGAAVACDDVEELIAAIRGYSTPPSTSPNKAMDRLGAHIRDWHPSDRESYAHGPGFFMGHRVRIDRAGNRAVALRCSGEGYDLTDVAMLEGFAAFTDRTVGYEGPIRLTYRIKPPVNIADQQLYRSSDQPKRIFGSLVMPLHVDRIAAHLQGITDCTDTVGLRIAQALVMPGTSSGKGKADAISIPGIKLTTGVAGTDFTLAEVNGEPASIQPVWKLGAQIIAGLPTLRVQVETSDSVRGSQIAGALLAVARTDTSEPHPAGSYDDAGKTFTFNPEVSARFIAQSRQEPLSPRSGSPPSGPRHRRPRRR